MYTSSQLGEYIDSALASLQSLGFRDTVRRFRTPSDIPLSVEHLPHPAARFLSYLARHGAPAKMRTAPWSSQRKLAAIRRGPHKSALEYADFLAQEMSEMVQRGQWMVLPFAAVQHLPNLRISPLGVVPQHERRPRTIVDLSFHGVNADTLPLAPLEAMQFGQALRRILQRLVQANPKFGPVHMIKVDISDGFYRVHLNPSDVPALGVAFPPAPDGTPLVAFPLALPMGWVLSPPFFSAATETIADLANQRLTSHYQPPHHRLESLADQPPPVDALPASQGPPVEPPPPHPFPLRVPLKFTDVYVDDFLQLIQGPPAVRAWARRVLFHTIDEVFRPHGEGDPPSRQEPISTKKLGKGDAHWSTRKVILGWILDTARETIELPPRRLQRLRDILASLPRTKKRIAVRQWHKILGELRSMTLAVPGLGGFFSLLQEALRHVAPARIRLTQAMDDFLDDIRFLVASLHDRPTRFREVVPTPLALIGATDAAAPGMGGVFFLPTPTGHQPCLWRAPFPPAIQHALVSWTNPTGTITNSDLELAGTIAQHDVIAHMFPLTERTIGTLTDNTPALAWQTKGSTTTTGPAAYLLWLQALHQREHRYLPRLAHIPGPVNVMADDCSRRWDLSDDALLSHFNNHYPQERPWRLCHLRPDWLSSLISALQRQRPDPALARGPLPMPPRPGISGGSSAANSTTIPTSRASLTQSSFSKCSLPGFGTGPSPATSPFMLERWLPGYATWARRYPFWGPLTLA